MSAKQAGGYTSAGIVLDNKDAKLPNISLMLLGKTGSGKSSLGNVILDKYGEKPPFTVTDNFYSTAVYAAVCAELNVHGRQVKVVDTPGVMDTNQQDSDEKALDGICDGISQCSEGVDAFLLVLRLDVRLTMEEFKAVAKLETLFGNKIWRHVILVFTHGDCVNNNMEKFRERLQVAEKQIPEFKNLMSKLHENATALLFDAREDRNPDVSDTQIQRLLFAVDALVKENKTKFTNELFLTANDEIKKLQITLLEEGKKRTHVELRLLRDKVTRLEEASMKDKKKIKDLEEEVKQKEKLINDAKKTVTEETRAKGKCVLL